LCLAIAVACLSARAPAAEPANLEGTWKISAPQSAFKPEGGSIPFTETGRKRYAANKRNLAKGAYEEYDYATARCASPGIPRLMLTPERFRVWQRPGWIGFQFEWNRLARQVDMGGLTQPQLNGTGDSPGSTENDQLVGRAVPISKGHWEGETLVVESEGFSDNTLIDNLVPHGFDLKTHGASPTQRRGHTRGSHQHQGSGVFHATLGDGRNLSAPTGRFVSGECLPRFARR